MNRSIMTTAALLAVGLTLCVSGCALTQPTRATSAVEQGVDQAAPQARPSWEPAP